MRKMVAEKKSGIVQGIQDGSGIQQDKINKKLATLDLVRYDTRGSCLQLFTTVYGHACMFLSSTKTTTFVLNAFRYLLLQ